MCEVHITSEKCLRDVYNILSQEFQLVLNNDELVKKFSLVYGIYFIMKYTINRIIYNLSIERFSFFFSFKGYSHCVSMYPESDSHAYDDSFD